MENSFIEEIRLQSYTTEINEKILCETINVKLTEYLKENIKSAIREHSKTHTAKYCNVNISKLVDQFIKTNNYEMYEQRTMKIIEKVVSDFKTEGFKVIADSGGYSQQHKLFIEWKFPNIFTRQRYTMKPLYLKDVKGGSSQTIFIFMSSKLYSTTDHMFSHPTDVDDWEGNRALLLEYPEWKSRLQEMAILSKQWKSLVENWDKIEAQYDEDCEVYGDKLIGRKCDLLINELIK